jgi:hypothetical protein
MTVIVVMPAVAAPIVVVIPVVLVVIPVIVVGRVDRHFRRGRGRGFGSWWRGRNGFGLRRRGNGTWARRSLRGRSRRRRGGGLLVGAAWSIAPRLSRGRRRDDELRRGRRLDPRPRSAAGGAPSGRSGRARPPRALRARGPGVRRVYARDRPRCNVCIADGFVLRGNHGYRAVGNKRPALVQRQGNHCKPDRRGHPEQRQGCTARALEQAATKHAWLPRRSQPSMYGLEMHRYVHRLPCRIGKT